MKRNFKRAAAVISVFLAALLVSMTAFAAPAATDPTLKYDGSYDSATGKYTLTISAKHPDATALTGQTVLEYDKELFATDDSKITKAGEPSILKGLSDADKGYTGVSWYTTDPIAKTDTYYPIAKIEFDLKSGKTVSDIKSDSIKLCDDASFPTDGTAHYKGGVISQDSDNKFSIENDKLNTVFNLVPANVPVTGVTVTPETASVEAGKTTKLTAAVAPDNATDKTVTWSSSDDSVATVDADGTVHGIKEGTATITATTKDGSKTDTCAVTVTAPTSKTITKLDPESVTTPAGSAPTLPAKVKATYSDGSTADVPVTWDAVAADKYAQPGTFTVNGTVEGTSLSAVANVTVTNAETPANPIKSIDKTTAKTTVNKAPTLPEKVKVTYEDGTTAEVPVVWDDIPKSDYSKAGTFTVSGTVAGTELIAVCEVKVTSTSGGNGKNPSTGESITQIYVLFVLLGLSAALMMISWTYVHKRKLEKAAAAAAQLRARMSRGGYSRSASAGRRPASVSQRDRERRELRRDDRDFDRLPSRRDDRYYDERYRRR